MNTTQRGFAEAVGLTIPENYSESNARCRTAAGLVGRMTLEGNPTLGLNHMIYSKIGGRWFRFDINEHGERGRKKEVHEAVIRGAIRTWLTNGNWREYLWFNPEGAKLIERQGAE